MVSQPILGDKTPPRGASQSRAYGAGVVFDPCRQRLGAETKRPNQMLDLIFAFALRHQQTKPEPPSRANCGRRSLPGISAYPPTASNRSASARDIHLKIIPRLADARPALRQPRHRQMAPRLSEIFGWLRCVSGALPVILWLQQTLGEHDQSGALDPMNSACLHRV